MADALVSPAVGGIMLAATAGLAVYSGKKVQSELDEKKIPLMGVMGAFVFASQMINFTIPGTGSSGHLGGGLMLATLLGPYAGFLVMAAILFIQALFFADGGILALGCNIFNLGFFTCFIAYPLIYKKIVGTFLNRRRLFTGSILAGVIGLQLGSLGVVLETHLSGITDLPLTTFLMWMQPVHLAIGLVEGLITATVICFIAQARPEILEKVSFNQPLGKVTIKPVLIGVLLVTLGIGGIFSWFASANPDGLEWSVFHVSNKEELPLPTEFHRMLSSFQSKIAFLPDYTFKTNQHSSKPNESPENVWPAVDQGTSVSGIIGAGVTLIFAIIIGFGLKMIRRVQRTS